MKRRDLGGVVACLPLHAVGNVAAVPQPSPGPLVFPRDFGAHPETRTEWWYLTGWLEAASASGVSGALLGFQVTFFRSRTDVAADHPSRFAARQLVFAHAALTDVAARMQRHDQRIARAGFGLAEAAADDTAVVLRDWRLARSGPVPGRYAARLRSESAGFALDLQLDTTQPVLLQGEAGFSRKGPRPGEASRYYSQPQLRVGGTLTRDGRPLAVTGRAWLDHEWSDAFLPRGAVGWDWVGMNLDDGSALTAFRLRRADGTTVYAGGSWRGPGGRMQDFAADAVHFRPERVWTSPASNARYPVAWSLDTPAGRFRIDALLDAQELDSRGSTGAFYWEGLSALTRDGARVGLGYLEMTGYASPLIL